MLSSVLSLDGNKAPHWSRFIADMLSLALVTFQKYDNYIIHYIVTTVSPAMNLTSALTLTLSWDTNAGNGTTFTVWYSTDSHESDPFTPPQGALVVSGLNSTSVTITLPDTDNSCKPYYVWISAITPNGQQSPYSRRRQVDVCRSRAGVHMHYIPVMLGVCRYTHIIKGI